ncbi:hypothetical protein VFPFJ_08286 [Purpureocillium lilacinum]|uniref:Uncharacterized protein n=1 Tax=Purpureocillium lilacinum TaxID=33203 RepID=A0A179H6W4_PURLI|nr:hypothetical protein VFPFJ_08286 [Purpureocillium lilacinum]OAQ77093.1 hypothetical protein VFPBJ_07565 [Purpureocillium lilacinum]OAQ85897.1 hypothetical protein VFPFJ_08286 [Purpureocillium lilacinum]
MTCRHYSHASKDVGDLTSAAGIRRYLDPHPRIPAASLQGFCTTLRFSSQSDCQGP